jgi:carboxylesterase
MTRHAHLDPSPFYLQGGPVGVLLLHGFTGAPPEMRLVGDHLHRQGLTVSGPLLPGHGRSVANMNRCKWTDWTGHAEAAMADLHARCDKVFVGGLSMGSLLTLHLAAQRPGISGAIVYSPTLKMRSRRIYLAPILKHLIPVIPKSSESDLADPQADLRLWSLEGYPVAAAHELLKLMLRVRRLLPQVTCPLLVIHAIRDRHLDPKSAVYTYKRVGSTDKELMTLRKSGHALTVDIEWKLVAQRTYSFIQARQ